MATKTFIVSVIYEWAMRLARASYQLAKKMVEKCHTRRAKVSYAFIFKPRNPWTPPHPSG